MATYLLPTIKRGIFWVVLGVLVVAVSLTAQAPKSLPSNQPVSEVGRYVFWSTNQGAKVPLAGFLDTKRGRVWVITEPDTTVGSVWLYFDLNDDAVAQVRVRLIQSFLKAKDTGDTTGFTEEKERMMQEIERIREQEK